MSSSPVEYFPSSPPQYTETPSPPISHVRAEIFARLVEIKMLFYQMNRPSFPRDDSHDDCKKSLVKRARIKMTLVKILEDFPLLMKDFRRRAKFIIEVGIYMTEDDVDEVDRAMIEKMSIAFDTIFADVTISDAKQMVAIVAGGPRFQKYRALVIADNVESIQEQIKKAGFVLEGVCVSGQEFSINISRKSNLKSKAKGKSAITANHSKEKLSITRSHGPKVVGQHVSSFSPRQVDRSSVKAMDAEVPPSERQSEGAIQGSSSHARKNRRQSGSAHDFQQQVIDYEATKVRSSAEETPSSDRTIEDDWEENDRLMRSQGAGSTIDKEDKEADRVYPVGAQGTNLQSGSVTRDLSPLVAEYHEDVNEEQTDNSAQAEFQANDETESIEWPSSPPSALFFPIETPQKISSSTESTLVGSKSSGFESSPPKLTLSAIDKGKAANRGSSYEVQNGLFANGHKSGPSPSRDGEKATRPDKGKVDFKNITPNANVEGASKHGSGFLLAANTLKGLPSISVTKSVVMFVEPQFEESPILPDLIPLLDSNNNNDFSLSALVNHNTPDLGSSKIVKTAATDNKEKELMREGEPARKGKKVMKGALGVEASTVTDQESQLNAWLSSSPDVSKASKLIILETLAQLAAEERKITSATNPQPENQHAIAPNVAADVPKLTTVPVTSTAAANIVATLPKRQLFRTKKTSLEKNDAADSHPIVKHNGDQSVRPSGVGASSNMPAKGPRKRTREMSEEDDSTQQLPHDLSVTAPLDAGKCLVANNGSPVTGERRFKKPRYNACTQKKRVDTIDYYTLSRPFKRSRFGRRGTRFRPSSRDGKENPFLTTGTPDIVERRRLFFSKRAADDGYDSDTREMAESFPAQYAEPGRIYDSSPEIMRSSLPKNVPPTLIANNAVTFVSEEAKDRAMRSWVMSDEEEGSQRSGIPSAPRKAVLPRIPLKRKSRN